MNDSVFPLAKYIVFCESDAEIPDYIKCPTARIKLTSDITVSPRNLDDWPMIHNFDGNQYSAFKAGLTQKFAIVQGPPGTGKTYLSG